MNVTLKKIDQSNILACLDLKLKAGQEKYVSSPTRSLAQAYVFYGQCTPFGIYAGDKLVGYVLVIYDYDEETYNIWHLMVDGAHQGKGYGKAAVGLCLEYIAAKPFGTSGRVLLTCHGDNEPAMHIYRAHGFTPTGNQLEDEIELGLDVDQRVISG